MSGKLGASEKRQIICPLKISAKRVQWRMCPVGLEGHAHPALASVLVQRTLVSRCAEPAAGAASAKLT